MSLSPTVLAWDGEDDWEFDVPDDVVVVEEQPALSPLLPVDVDSHEESVVVEQLVNLQEDFILEHSIHGESSPNELFRDLFTDVDDELFLGFETIKNSNLT